MLCMKCIEQLQEEGCLPEFIELAYLIMQENNLQMPNNAAEAKDLYIALSNHIEQISDD